MKHHKAFPDPAEAHALMDEADIGSGEKTAAERETDDMIRQIPRQPGENGEDNGVGDGEFDAEATRQRLEQHASLERDDPNEPLDELDPVPPKGE